MASVRLESEARSPASQAIRPPRTTIRPGSCSVVASSFWVASARSSSYGRKIKNAFDSPNVDADFSSKRTTTIPRFIGTVVKFGRKRFGDHQFALAYSTLEVDRNDVNAGSVQVNTDSSLDLRLNNDYSSRWYGVSFAAQATEENRAWVHGLRCTAARVLQRRHRARDRWNARRDRSPSRWRLGHVEHVAFGSELGHRPSAGCAPSVQPPLAAGHLVPTPGIPVSRKGSVFRRLTSTIAARIPSIFCSIRETSPRGRQSPGSFGPVSNSRPIR